MKELLGGAMLFSLIAGTILLNKYVQKWYDKHGTAVESEELLRSYVWKFDAPKPWYVKLHYHLRGQYD